LSRQHQPRASPSRNPDLVFHIDLINIISSSANHCFTLSIIFS
jgi:hypothetical protein